MNGALISIIVPAYNIEKYIERCLKSISGQTYNNLEIIVVDDGSTDSTGKLIDNYKLIDNRVIIIHKNNGGVSSARTAGLAMATGAYIGFVDGDDYIEPQMYERLMNNMLKYHADISHCGYKMLFPDGHIDFYYNTGKVVEQTHEEGLRDLLSGVFVEPGLWNKLYRKSIVNDFDKSPLWDESIRINEDLLLNYIFFKKSVKAIYEDIPMYHYILRKGSATSKIQPYKLLDPIKVLEYILQDLKESKYLYSIAEERYIRVLLNVSVQQEWKEIAENARRLIKRNFFEITRLKNFSRKLCLMALLGGYFPVLYSYIRRKYDSITGISNKYNLD